MMACFVMLYALWGLKAWGRYMALIYVSTWFVLYIIISSLPTSRVFPLLTDPIMWVEALLRGVTFVVCLRGDVKELMCHEWRVRRQRER